MANPTDPLILIVEDEPAQLEVLNYNISAAGYRVTTASDGEDALLKIEKPARFARDASHNVVSARRGS